MTMMQTSNQIDRSGFKKLTELFSAVCFDKVATFLNYIYAQGIDCSIDVEDSSSQILKFHSIPQHQLAFLMGL